MRTTIDAAGRIVIPKAVRDAAGLEAGAEIEVGLRDGVIEIAPAPVPMRVARRANGVAVVEADAEMPTLTVDVVRETLERTRR
jgi:AbrB family looped-hinge helix DNA binding protein